MEEENDMPGLRSRRKKPSIGVSSCFGGGNQRRRGSSFDVSSSSFSCYPTPRPSPKAKRRSFISCMSRHRRHSSADFDFSYDSLSYALNFEDDIVPEISGDYYRSTNFISRSPRTTAWNHNLPKSPTPRAGDSLRRGFEALSLSMSRRKAPSDLEVEPSPDDAAAAICPNPGVLVDLT